jgi:hypothetical protein
MEEFNNGISIYYKHRRQDETVESNLTQVAPDEYRVNTLGARYSKKRLVLLAEQIKRDAPRLPSTTNRLRGSYTWDVDPDTRTTVYASKQWVDVGEPDNRDAALFTSGADVSTRLSDKYNITTGVDYRDEDDSKFGQTKGFGLNSELQYEYRMLNVATGFEFNILERNADKYDSFYWYLRLKRRF